MAGTGDANQRQRVDRWLWAARFFKSRSLARKAAELGRIQVNGQRARPARAIAPGDELSIRCPSGDFVVIVEGLNLERRPAAEAQALYRETPESAAARERAREERRARAARVAFDSARPDRRTRREAIRNRRRGPDDD